MRAPIVNGALAGRPRVLSGLGRGLPFPLLEYLKALYRWGGVMTEAKLAHGPPQAALEQAKGLVLPQRRDRCML